MPTGERFLNEGVDPELQYFMASHVKQEMF